jgi:glycosyltransferase involved in cell wall biosynthesis
LTGKGEVGSRISDLGIPLMALDMHRNITSLSTFLKLIQYLREIKPDLVHTWMYHADLIGGIAAKISKVPTIVWGVRSADFLHSKTRFLTRLTLLICAKLSSWLPNVVIYNSHKGVSYHKAMGYQEKYSVVISNGVDIDKFHPNNLARLKIRKDLGLSTQSVLIGIIGRYDLLKNHNGFIDAVTFFNRSAMNVHFLMVGNGLDSSNTAITRKLKNNKIETYCHLLGHRQDIPEIMAALDLLSLTSTSEAFPNVLIEAMACGVPCVATDVGDATLILEGSGWIIPINDMRALANTWEAFLSMSNEQIKYYRLRARERIKKYYEINHVLRQYEDVYKKSKNIIM